MSFLSTFLFILGISNSIESSKYSEEHLYNAGTFYGTKPHCTFLHILSHCTITVTEIVPSLRRQLSSSVRRQSRAIAPVSLHAPPAATSSPVCGSPPERSRGSSHLQTSFSRDFLAAPDAARSYHWAPGESLLHFSDRPVRLAAAYCGHARLVWQRSMW